MKPMEATLSTIESEDVVQKPKKQVLYITKENIDEMISQAIEHKEEGRVILDLTSYNGSISNVIFLMQSNKVEFALNNPHLLYHRVNHAQFKERIKQLTNYRIQFTYYKPKINCLLAFIRYSTSIRLYRFHMGFVAKSYRKLKRTIHKIIYGDMR